MADPPPSSYIHIIRTNRHRLETLIHEGKYKPVFVWHLVLLTALPLMALLVPRRNGARYVRRVVLGLVLSMNIEALRYRRALLGANGYMVGLITTWWTIWTATLLVFHDPELEFRRIERAPTNPSTQPNGYSQNTSKATDNFKWQSYPRPFRHRLNWALGLLLNMRGPEWNWRISSLDPLPPALVHEPRIKQTRTELASVSPDARTRLRSVARVWLKAYFALDIVKVIMMQDPYFWGVIDCSTPFPFSLLPAQITPSVVYIYRFIMTGTGIFVALTYVCALNPLIFLGLSVAFPRASRAVTATPLDAPWIYADIFGQFSIPVLDHGLAGCWSQWWHQLFRFGFTSTASWLLSWLPRRYATHPDVKRIGMAFVAFGLSGLVHATGSYTQLSETSPVSGTWRFFILQAVGIVIQGSIVKLVVPAILPREVVVARWMRRMANVLFATGWLLFTAGYD
ncbi:hypothetical protein FE257_005214 [Aspergillus nanangensis]|uniref:Wax synthase domain-containing protein n=1 Tax=Aspergillus nanangensis TaxID=2582783 RepID=A0AAD4CSK7_ASPNN|nr:hypothetical protein FE257_005214 [Aspergillus nanangensis]